MDLGVISVRYARALIKSATASKLEDQVYKEMSVLSTNYIRVPELRFTIDNPMLSKAKKQQLLETACGGTPSPTHRSLYCFGTEGGQGERTTIHGDLLHHSL